MLSQSRHLAVVEIFYLMVQCFADYIRVSFSEVFFFYFGLNHKMFHHLEFKGFFIFIVGILFAQPYAYRIHGVVEVDGQTLTKQCMPAALVNNIALRVHYIVVLQQVFTHTEVVLFYFFLCTLYRLRDHAMLQYFAIFMTHLIHEAGYTV